MSHTVEAPCVPKDKRASIAVDLGAESCRVSLLRWIDGQPETTLVHRFANSPVAMDGALRWPLSGIVAGVENGMRQCAALATEGIRSVAVDGWAVDYVRVDDRGLPLAEPFCYRDERTAESERLLHERISAERMQQITGIQLLPLNTLYQLYADRLAGVPTGRRWLNLPEYLLSHWGGDPVSEFTNATHTQLVDLRTGQWSDEIFNAAELERSRAPRLVPPGTVLGQLQGPLSALPAFRDTLLIAPACHDTASALAGIPAHGDEWAYISSGTWSLVGALVHQPLSDSDIRADNFTNLGGVGGTTCFHRNVNGMWLLKQCMDTWAASGTNLALGELLEAAGTLPKPVGLLTVDDPELLLVGDMPARINAQRMRTGLAAIDETPAHAAEVVALILHSLAARYAEVFARLQVHTGKRLKRVFIVGGGSRNRLLNRLTAEATGLEVVCGPAESSTIGNLAVQMAVLESGNPCTSPAFAGDVARWAATLHPVPPETPSLTI